MNINRERLAELFTTLCEIDSPSQQEGRVAEYLKKIFSDMAVEVLKDTSADQTGSDSNNLLARFPGNLGQAPIFFCCHMDTVLPAEGVKVRRE